MNTIPVMFSRSRTPGSFLIRHWQHSPYSHVAIVDHGCVIEARFGEGVTCTPLNIAKGRTSQYEILDIPCGDKWATYAAAYSQVGKKYDWRAPIGVGLRSDWEFTDRWDCIELIAWAWAQGGRPLFRGDKHHRLKPHDLYLPLFQNVI